jgi:predicted Ser/Thr protein kinase
MIKLYGGINIKELQLIGSGTQGKVYRIDSQRCIKIFKSKNICKDELETLIIAQIDPHFPKLYAYGENYIIREFIDGIELDKFLSKNNLTTDISNRILGLYDAMARVGFNRLDSALFHIFITVAKNLKIIDTSKAIKKSTIYPALIIKGLAEYGYKRQFLNFVKDTRPELYIKWQQCDKLLEAGD